MNERVYEQRTVIHVTDEVLEALLFIIGKTKENLRIATRRARASVS